MDTATTPRATQTSDAERLQQEQSFRVREIKKRNQEEIDALTQKHESDLKTMESAFRVEIGAQREDFDRKTSEMNATQAQRLATLSQQNEINMKQAQDTYRMQADQLRVQGEKKLGSIREEQALATENVSKKGKA